MTLHRPTLFRTLVVAAAASLTATAVGLGLGTADAATPTSGSVSDASPTVTWGGGPFVTPNATGNALDQPDCSVPSSCDDFALHVDTPAGYGDTHTLNVKVSWANAAADFDVYVLDKAGDVVGTSASNADPEQVILPPAAGDYTVRVVPYAPVGESYDATATLTTTPSNPAPGTDTPPAFTAYAAPASLSDANNAGEPSIGNSFKTGSTFFQAYLSTYKVAFDDSSPAKATWTDVSANASNGCVAGSTVSLDPILFTDHKTGRTFESQLTGANSATCWTDDDGKTWNNTTGGGVKSGVDHQTIGGGPYAASGIGGLPTSTYPDAVYYCSQDIATAFCAASHDGGTTYGPGVPTYSLLDCGGLHGHIKVAPDGTAYLPNKGCGESQAAVVSTDNGQSWDVRNVPGATPGSSDPSVGVAADGTTYFGYVGADGKPGVATSRDQGRTWTDRQTVGTAPGVKSAVFPTVVAGDDDRASIAYLGTTTEGNYESPTFDGEWHLYIDTTYDGGKTWVTSDATGADPVQRGSICTSGTTCGDNRNLLDFIDVTLDDHGRVEVGFADGCIKTCVADKSQNSNTKASDQPDAHAAYATIARQSGGKTLFSKYDPDVTNATLSSQTVTTASGARVTAAPTVTNTGTTTLSNVAVQVLDGTKRVGLTSIASLAPGASKTLSVSWKSAKGTRTITSTVDPQNVISESDEKDNSATKTVTLR